MSKKIKFSQKPDLSSLKASWGSPLVAREEVGKFSGGVLHSRSMANLDYANEGPKGRIRIGRKIVYYTDSLIAWMEERAEQL